MTDSLAKQFGDHLVVARGDRSRRSLALEHEVSHISLMALEKGTDNPTLGRLAQVGRYYGIEFIILSAPIDPGETNDQQVV